ncbi:hypothetical protein OBBRIDRAFT_765320 [Obba rivulosa]|uniref:ARID domain-containing protein n=1 Tax=Obba rivulosa TaxID=1052685 RepID=A0A8E2J7D9_9APHY|nr:hypothetical protein OBBRIDRAFT_765320 [Obba rivulosa]
MAMLQAASIAKAANRSAPGGTSVPYFGGLSTAQPAAPPRHDPPQDVSAHAPSGLPDFQIPNHQQNPNAAAASSPVMLQQQQQQQQHQQRKRSFLNGLSNLMTHRNMPLPPALTGVPFPSGYDPNNSPWKNLEVSPLDIGIIRLAGKDIDLYRLWGMVQQAGGSQKITQSNMWHNLLPHLDLPEQLPNPHPNGQHSTAAVLAQYYKVLIGPFEEAYRKNYDPRATMAGRPPSGPQGMPMAGSPQRPGSMSGMPGAFPPNGAIPGPMGSTPSMMGMGPTPSQSLDPLAASASGSFTTPNLSHTPQIPQHAMGNGSHITPDARQGMQSTLSESLLGGPSISRSQSVGGYPFPPAASDASLDGDQDSESRKRKMRVSEEQDSKRARQKTGGSDGSDGHMSIGLDRNSVPPSSASAAGSAAPARTIRQPARRKIEYIPFARELDSHGGRDLDAVQKEYLRAARRPNKPLDDWGRVDIEALTMSLRSRLSTELSYALSTFTFISTMPGNHKDSGFPISQAPDLLDELLDLLEDLAFDGIDDASELEDPPGPHIWTYRELSNLLVEEGLKPFAGLKSYQGEKDPKLGPKQRPGDIILCAVNILRNLSNFPDNHEHLAKHDRFLPIIFRLCDLAPADPKGTPRPASSVLSLADLLVLRKDTVNILINVAGFVNLSSMSGSEASTLLSVRRAFETMACFLTDPVEAVPPFQSLMLHGMPPTVQQAKPSPLADVTLEALTRLLQPDDNRQLAAKAVPQEWLWETMEALVHRLPVADNDFQVIMRESWLAYIEKLVMAIYALAFLAPPPVKRRVKTDRRLGFTKVLLRFVKKFTLHATPEMRAWFSVAVRRAIEAMKLIDDADADSFDVSQQTSPTLTFGVGYGEHGEARMEKGMGLLSGYQEEITWGLMTHRDIDELIFQELESLVRIG